MSATVSMAFAMTTQTITGTPMPTGSVTNNTSNSNSKSLLYFVALGFGVLFTNLWIIIGVKYCFRYQNARRRGLTTNIGLDGMPLVPVTHGRRRREKKLMTMEEVETQFPQMTYKAWRSQRERLGLSTEGGVEAMDQEGAETARDALGGRASTRPGSIRTIDTRRGSMHSLRPAETVRSGVYEVGDTDIYVKDDAQTSGEISHVEKTTIHTTCPSKRVSTAVEHEVQEYGQSLSSSDDQPVPDSTHGLPVESDEVVEAVPDETEIEHLPQDIGSGDTCAICIDQLEADDEIRGLTCGHAFHCSCVDVWLTTRRAICPLCKRDYWVRKPSQNRARTTSIPQETQQQVSYVEPIVINPLRAGFWRIPHRVQRNSPPTRGLVASSRDLEHGPLRAQGHHF